jgi:hypothetical protein
MGTGSYVYVGVITRTIQALLLLIHCMRCKLVHDGIVFGVEVVECANYFYTGILIQTMIFVSPMILQMYVS